ncbi:class I SAM-dependent methyltransferase [Georgenia yuyongxinii]|uniref:Class I SAM-dependent methyltransferase n=2 Tax=Georgenia yuyongxinii TaxID=2589797 RepID=A0A5B8C8V4_9MICO|nr:class I SAM-dependent methyltransferase [Georgenia yuyongxinii]
MGRWSRPLAAAFVEWLGAPDGLEWLDVGCGTGAVTAAIVTGAAPSAVLAIDPSPGFVATARRLTASPLARFTVGDAATLPMGDDAVDRCVSGLVVNFLPDASAAVAEMRRVTRRGGWVAAYVWDYAGGMELLREFWAAAVTVDPGAAQMDERHRFPLCAPGPLGELWRSAGLDGVESRPLTVSTHFPDFDDLWAPFLGGQGPAPAYVGSLTPERRPALARELRRRLHPSADGAIELTARAWAVRGRRR